MRRWSTEVPRRFSSVLTAVALGVWVFVVSPSAHADDVPLRRMRFAEYRGQLVVSSSFSELVDKRAFDRLSSGVPTTVVVRGWVNRVGRDVPAGFTVATFRVVYDLWDDLYTVTYQGPDGARKTRTRSKIDVLESITRLKSLPIADLRAIAIGPHHVFETTIELNPTTEEILDEARRWLRSPARERSLDPSSSVFGAFVAVFVNPNLSGAERVLRFRSQPFYRVPR